MYVNNNKLTTACTSGNFLAKYVEAKPPILQPYSTILLGLNFKCFIANSITVSAAFFSCSIYGTPYKKKIIKRK